MLSVQPLTEREIRCLVRERVEGRGPAPQPPADLDELAWEQREFLGWVDPRAPLAATWSCPPTTTGRSGSCCAATPPVPDRAGTDVLALHDHPPGQGVALMVANRAGRAGRDGNTVGLDICASLECSSYARGLLPPAMTAAHETLTVEDRVARLRRNVLTFVESGAGVAPT